MRNRLLKLASVMLILVITLTSLTTTVFAQTNVTCYTFEVEDIKNPLYEDYSTDEISAFSLTPKRYYSKGENFDTNLCISDYDSIAEDLREVMVERGASIDIYYKDTVALDGDTLYNILIQWRDLALCETENAYEGDYLRYVWSGITPDTITYISCGTYYYYHIPLNITYYTTKAQEDAFDAELEKVIESFGFTGASTPRQKSDKIYKYITENVTYDYANLNDDTYTLKYSAYAALINKTAVCQGYATLYYRLARECGLDTRVITGTSRGENHAWNIVKMGNYYYYLDSTWDAGKTVYDYYLKGSTSFSTGHTPEDKYSQAEFTQKYPISTTDMNLSDNGYSQLYDYDVYLGKAIITRYKGNEKHIVVPAYLDGYPVERIGKKVFSQNDNIESITFSEGINYIEGETIIQCNGLKQINFPASMMVNYEKYGDPALGGYSAVPAYCNNIETLTVASGDNAKMKVVDGILYSADGTGLIMCPPKYDKTKVTIPNGVTTIAPSAFYGCVNIKEVVMPDTVKYIGYWSFCTAFNLEKINISKDCRIIGQFAFASTNLTEIYIPASVETIMGATFGIECDLKKITVDLENENFYKENGALIYHNKEYDTRVIIDYETDNAATVFTLPANVGYIEQYAFAHAQNLKEIKLHNGVEQICVSAFEDCRSLTHFEFPNSIETIENNVLFGCESLASIIIPASVTEIGDMMVWGNEGYTVYGETGSFAEQYAAQNLLKFKTIDQFICTSGHVLKDTVKDEFSHRLVCQNCGDEAKMHYLTPIEPFAQFAKVEYESYKYTGSEIKPRITEFEHEGKKFVEGVDYEITGYYNNVNAGTGNIEVKGIGDYAGTGYIYFQIIPRHISEKAIGIEYLSTVYDGYEKCPIIEIEGLRQFENFDVTYSNNIEVGTATVTINAWGNYEGTVVTTFEIYLPATAKLSAELYSSDDVKLSWQKVAGANGYYVYYKKSGDASYTRVGATAGLSYSIANLADNAKYTFKVAAYRTVGSAKKESALYKTATVTTLRDLSAPSKVTLSLYGYDDVKVSWSKVSYAKGYYVYYKKPADKNYTYAGRTTATSFKKANLSDGVKYTFKVVPYGLSGSKVILDDSYKTATIYTLKKLSTPKVSKSSSKKVKVSWSNIGGESGYQISQSTSKSKTKIVSTYSTTSGKSKKIKATKKKTYYYKVRAYKTVNGKKIYGPWSSVKKYKLK